MAKKPWLRCWIYEIACFFDRQKSEYKQIPRNIRDICYLILGFAGLLATFGAVKLLGCLGI